ncbi:hypothetical protein ACDT12_13505, partial [Staphylococcus aureus]
MRFEGPYSIARNGQLQPRLVYLLPSNFKQKQQWVAALEAVVNSNPNSRHKIKDVKILGNLLFRLNTGRGSSKMEIDQVY